MISLIVITGSIMVGSLAQQGSDMDDSDFERYLEVHENFREHAAEYSDSFGRGCVKGAATGAFTGKGFQALCIGCAVGGASETVAEIVYPKNKDK